MTFNINIYWIVQSKTTGNFYCRRYSFRVAMKTEVYVFSIVLLLAFRTSLLDLAFGEGERTAYLLSNSTIFSIPNGTYRLRVLAVGGGGGGCGGIKQGRSRSGDPAVNIIHVSGPTTVNVSIGRGGQGAKGHSVESVSNGISSQFGNYVTARGGRGCTRDVLDYSLIQVKGIRHLRSSEITKGTNGMDFVLPTSTVQGGDGGILINGSGPSGEAGGGNISAAGGAGYGAGGGAGGAVYLLSGPLIYSGGRGADGVVYVEMIDSVCLRPIDIIFAVESRDSAREFNLQLQHIRDITRHFQISHDRTRVALISYGSEVHLKFGFNDFTDSNSLQKALANIKNDLNTSKEVHFANVYATALIAFFESRSSKALVLLTFAGNDTHSDLMQIMLSNTRNQGISISVVAMGNKTSKLGLVNLVEHEHDLFTGGTTDVVDVEIPWIVDFICQGSEPKKSDTSTAVTSSFTLSSSVTPQSINSTIKVISLQPTPSLSVATGTTDVSDRQSLPSPTITASATVSAESTVSSQDHNHRTVEELEKDLDDVLSFNISSVNIQDITKVKSYVRLAGDLLAESHRIPNASERGIEYKLVKRVENIGLTVAEQMEPSSDGYKAVTLSSGKVDMAVASVNLTQIKQLRFPDIRSDDFGNNSLQYFGNVVLPRAAFAPNATSELGQVVWMMFDALTAMNDSANHVVRSRIMNIIARPQRKQEFEKPVTMTFWLSEKILSNMNCVFWNQNNPKQHGVWSTDGCQVVQRNSSTATCYCNHLTSFAVLTRVTQYQPSKVHELPLSIITCVGCGLSVLGCVLTILTYAFLPSLRSQRIIIHVNLVTAILLAQVLFLVSAFGVRPGTSRVACYTVAVGLFFFFLCVFSWMLAEGLHIYFMVVRVFDSGRGRKLYYMLIGWGFPFIVTVVVVAIFQSRLLSKDTCWLSVETGAIWSFVGPAIFVMTINLVILIMVMRVTSKMLNEESPSNIRSLAKAFVTLLPILGLTWVFGLLAVNNSSVVFEYLFAIFNSLQGFLVFLFYCLRNTEVRREFKRKLHNLEAQRRPNTSSNPSTTPRNPPLEIEGRRLCHTRGQHKIVEESSFDTKL